MKRCGFWLGDDGTMLPVESTEQMISRVSKGANGERHQVMRRRGSICPTSSIVMYGRTSPSHTHTLPLPSRRAQTTQTRRWRQIARSPVQPRWTGRRMLPAEGGEGEVEGVHEGGGKWSEGVKDGSGGSSECRGGGQESSFG